MSGRPINEDRQNAISLGLKTYTGSKHSKCGTTERYVSGGSCVHCARVIAAEQRDARTFLRQHALDEELAKQQEQDGIALDNPEPMALEETDDAEARRLQAIEDLM
jgi:hypothetical protein